MRILVTGGAGFLGSRLCEFLLEKGYEVICEILRWKPTVFLEEGLKKN